MPLGLVWWLLAPQPLLERRADGVFRLSEVDESAVAADGWFALLAIAFGVVAGLVGYLLTRPARLGHLVGLVVGGLGGAVVAWRTGVLLGPDSLAASARDVAVGTQFHGPLELSALGVLLAWPMGAVITYFAATASAEAHESEAHTERLVEPGEPADAAGSRRPPV